jgi:transcriptional regulator with XRE-family HTH domain
MEQSSRKIGDFIRFYRKQSSISLNEAARRMRMSAATLSRVEHGEAMQFATAVKILYWLACEDEPE